MYETHAEKALAWAVVQRAILDLTSTHERDADVIRRDAYHFLTKRLWSEECLWQDLLCDVLIQRPLIDAIHLRVKCLSNGQIEVL